MLARLARMGTAFTAFSERYIPSAFSIAILLTFAVFGLAMVAVGAGPLEVVIEWGNGFWALIPFAMQMALVALTGYIVSVSPPANRLLLWVADRATSPRGAVTLMAVTSMLLSWLHWGIGMMGCAMLVRHIAKVQPNVEYRLLVASAYIGPAATFHAGLSGSAPLLVATPGHFLEDQIGLIPTAATIFQPFSLGLVVVVIAALTVVVWAMHPEPSEVKRVDPATLQLFDRVESAEHGPEQTPAASLDHSRWLNVLIGVTGLVWLVWYFGTRGPELTLIVVNFALLTLGILLHRSPAAVAAAADQGIRLVSGIVLQFPFYAGIFGIIQGTGLARRLGDWIASTASTNTFPLAVYWYSGIVNYFVPSGGSKWAIEAPILVEAGARLGVGAEQVVLAYSWGDMSTNLIHPFWALPLLAAAHLGFREIIAYAMVLFLVNLAIVSAAFALWPMLW